MTGLRVPPTPGVEAPTHGPRLDALAAGGRRGRACGRAGSRRSGRARRGAGVRAGRGPRGRARQGGNPRGRGRSRNRQDPARAEPRRRGSGRRRDGVPWPCPSLRAQPAVRRRRGRARTASTRSRPRDGGDRHLAGGHGPTDRCRRRPPVPGHRADRRPRGDVVHGATGAARHRGPPLGGHREPVGDLVGGPTAAVVTPAGRGDRPPVTAVERGRSAPR